MTDGENDIGNVLLKSIPFCMDIVTKDGTILFANDILKKILNKKPEGKKCWTLYKDNKKQCKSCPLKKKIAIGETQTIEVFGCLGGRILRISHTGM